MKLTKLLFCLLLSATLMASDKIDINFKDLEIEDFIKTVAKITDKNILLTQNIRGKINFISVKPIEKERLYILLQQILQTKGYTIVENSAGFLNVIRASDAVRENLPVNLNANITQMVTEIIKLNNENIDIAASKIRHMLSKNAKLVTSKEINSIIISEYPENIKTIKRILRNIDAKNRKSVEFIPLKYAKAKALVPEIVKIAKATLNQKIDEDKVDVLKNDATNSIILIATKKNINKLKVYIDEFDKDDEETAPQVKLIPLKNAETKDVVKVVNAVISKRVYKAGELRPTITSDDSLNAIVLMGSPDDIKELQVLIDSLDVERQQVYVQAKIIEISNNKLEEFGFKYGILTAPFMSGNNLFSLSTLLGDGSDIAGAAISAAANIPGFDVNDILKTKNKTTYKTTEVKVTNSDTGETTTTYESQPMTESYVAAPDFGLAVSLSLLDSAGATNKLSEPSLLCINNQESSIYVGETRRVQTGSVVGTTTQNTTKVEDIGLTLKIKPRLSNDQKVLLEVTTKLEDVIPGSNQDGTTKREVKTKAIVKNGESVILGGLIRDSIQGATSKVPFLGEIPVLGDLLFTHKRKNIDKINLVIILRPYIIDSSSDLTDFKKKLTKLNQIESTYAKNVLKVLGIDDENQSKKLDTENSKVGATGNKSLDFLRPDYEDDY